LSLVVVKTANPDATRHLETVARRLCQGTPLLQDTTLLANLKWGNQKAHPDDEIWALARKMGLSKPLLGAGEFQARRAARGRRAGTPRYDRNEVTSTSDLI
jgi:hypothetical protein